MTELALGSRELDVMRVLWDLGSGTVTEVRDHLPVDLAYTTVLTILRNLEEKSYVSRSSEGRAHRYSPRVDRAAARRSAIARVVDTLFHGAPEELVLHMVEDRTLSKADVRKLRALIDAPERAPRKR
ncbi:MAG TPA: BlaI/MecI/CopY family transcriptional regulator [Gemmatimonadaceae bacterium]|nr:BlaI/MecI/CopY family transcriptional regulator [Gemmatimonadaceae bacterium]